jgi:hypothetical protein
MLIQTISANEVIGIIAEELKEKEKLAKKKKKGGGKMENISHIELGFENCEELVISADDVTFLYAGGITEQLRFGNGTALMTGKQATYFRLSVRNRPAYARLAEHPDIVDVALKQHGGKAVYFSVDYDEVMGGNNDNQRIHTTPDEISVCVKPQEGVE